MRFWIYAEVVKNWVRKDVPVLAGLMGEYEETTKVLSIRDADPSPPGIVLGGTYKVRIDENPHSVSFRCACTAIEGRTFRFLFAVPLTEPPVPPKPDGEPKEIKKDPPLEDPEIKKRYEKRIAEEDRQKEEAEKREAQRIAAEAAKQAEIDAFFKEKFDEAKQVEIEEFFKRKVEEAKEVEPDVDPIDEEPDLVTDITETGREETLPTEEPDAAELERLAAEEQQRAAAEESERLAAEEAQRLADEDARRFADEAAQRLAEEEAQRVAAEAEREAERIAAEEAAREAAQEAADRAVEVEELARQSASAGASAATGGGYDDKELVDKIMLAVEDAEGGDDEGDGK